MFSRRMLERFENPGKTGPLEGATHVGVAGEPGNGPSMQFWFVVADGIVADASFETFPCPAAIACGSVVAEVAIGRSIETVQCITSPDVAALVGGLPEGKEYCAELTATAVARIGRIQQ